MSKQRGGAKRTVLIALCCILAVLLAALLVVTIVANRLLDQVQRPADTTLSSSEIEEILNGNTTSGTTLVEGDTQPGTEPIETQEATESAGTVEATKPTEPAQSKEVLNFLLIGQNANTAASWQNADVIILCTVNKTDKTLKLTSFQRDATVQIPGYGNNKLSVAYAIGGMKLLDQTLEENYGVKIDANIAVNYGGLIDLVDMVGGIQINLTAEEANYLNAHGNWGVTTMGGWNLKAGENTLDGAQAMGYSLIKKTGGEEERTSRQRNVIAALTEQAKKLSITQLYDFVEEALRCVATDMTDSEILGYVAELAPLLTEMKRIH